MKQETSSYLRRPVLVTQDEKVKRFITKQGGRVSMAGAGF